MPSFDPRRSRTNDVVRQAHTVARWLSNDALGAVQLFAKKHGSRTHTQSSMLCSKWNWNESHSHSERADKLLEVTVMSFLKRVTSPVLHPRLSGHYPKVTHWIWRPCIGYTLGWGRPLEEKKYRIIVIEITRRTIGVMHVQLLSAIQSYRGMRSMGSQVQNDVHAVPLAMLAWKAGDGHLNCLLIGTYSCELFLLWPWN